MSNDGNPLANFVAGVMARIFSLRVAGNELVESLHGEIAAGSRTATDKLNNPWNSSVSPKRRKKEIETRLNELRDKLEVISSEFLAKVL